MFEIDDIRHLASKHVWDRSQRILGSVVDVRIGNFTLSGLVLASEKSYLYNPHVTADGKIFCDCQGFAGQLCSHIVAIMRKADMDGYDIEKFIKGLMGLYCEEKDMMFTWKTSLEGYNKLFGGLQGGRHPCELFAEPQVGKSYMSTQFAVDVALMHGKNSLIIDTEGGVAPDWIERIAKSRGKNVDTVFVDWDVRVTEKGGTIAVEELDYDLKIDEPKNPTVYIYDARHLAKILAFFGRPQEFKVKGGVIEPNETSNTVDIYSSPIAKVIEKCNIGYVANDSLSAPIENFFTGGQINYRTRTKATQVWLGRVQDLIDAYKLVFMNIAHATIQHNNPMKGLTARPVGGKAVLHNNKYIGFMLNYENKKLEDWRSLRKMIIFRHMTKAAWSEDCYFKITDHGFEDFEPTTRGAPAQKEEVKVEEEDEEE